MIDIETLQQKVAQYRKRTYRTTASLRLHNPQDAIDFVNERGFIFFWPIKNFDLPNLWRATAGENSSSTNHDDVGDITWNWKDSLLNKRVWYYGKLVRKKATIISLRMAPYFYALSPNYGDYESDYLLEYKSGLMSVEMKNVYEALLQYGPLHTIDLHRITHMNSAHSKYVFNKTITNLQSEMKIIPIGIAIAGRWGYAMIYDIAARHYPEIVEKARFISEAKAQQTILLAYLRSVGLTNFCTIQRFFGWQESYIEQACKALEEQNEITRISGSKLCQATYVFKEIFRLE